MRTVPAGLCLPTVFGLVCRSWTSPGLLGGPCPFPVDGVFDAAAVGKPREPIVEDAVSRKPSTARHTDRIRV